MVRAIRWAGDCDRSKQRDRRVVMSTMRSGWKEEQVSVKYCMTGDTNLLSHSEQKIANCLYPRVLRCSDVPTCSLGHPTALHSQISEKARSLSACIENGHRAGLGVDDTEGL